MHLTTKSLISLFVLCAFCTAATAQEIKLYKAGTTLNLIEDLHCMDNDTALKLSQKLRLLPQQCALKISELEKLHSLELKSLESKLDLQKKEHLSIISEKDKAIDQIQIAAIDEVSKIENSIWWKVTLGVVGGLLVGAGVTALVMEFTE
tara:strand:+ start:2017 stop:2463 length:447 start_codon:yes stop_codon:yes gene_type:complete